MPTLGKVIRIGPQGGGYDPRVHSLPINPPVTSSQHHSPCSSPLCTLLQPTVSQFLSPTNISLPINPPVTSSQHHSTCSSSLCTLLQPTVSHFLSPTNISLPIQSPSNIQSAPLTMQLHTMHSPTFNCFPIPLTHQYLPSHSIPQ